MRTPQSAALVAAFFVGACASLPTGLTADDCRLLGLSHWQTLADDYAEVPNLQVDEIKDRQGFMDRLNALPPQTQFPTPDRIYYLHSSSTDVYGVNYVHRGCLIHTELVGARAFLALRDGGPEA